MNKEIFKKIKKEVLTPEEKSEGLFLLKDFINAHPVEYTKESENLPKETPYLVKSPYFTMLFMRQKVFVPVGIALLLLFVTGGTTFAANFALPGDVLYPIKIHIKEKMDRFVAVGTRAKTEVNIRHAVERLKEAEKLSDRSKLNDDNRAKIRDNLSVQLNEVSDSVNKLKKVGKNKEAGEVTSGFEKSLEEHQNIILRLGDKNELSNKITASTTSSSRNKKDTEEEKSDKEKALEVLKNIKENRNSKKETGGRSNNDSSDNKFETQKVEIKADVRIFE